MIKFRRLLKSFTYSFKGLQKVVREEQNIKIQLIIGTIIVLLGIFLQISASEWIPLILSMAMVILAEVLNSAVERVADVLKPRINEYVREIKDIMAGAVMITAITSIIIGILVFLPHLLEFLQ
jgi:diacylglycerol kinase